MKNEQRIKGMQRIDKHLNKFGYGLNTVKKGVRQPFSYSAMKEKGVKTRIVKVKNWFGQQVFIGGQWLNYRGINLK